jgi:hypothetical protein
MELELHRLSEINSATVGQLLKDGVFFCHTLEDVVRPLGPNGEGKVLHETAIPAGRYEVIANMSPKFKRVLPRLLLVPGFDGILIHPGTTHEHTWGCILVGEKVNVERGTLVPGTGKALVDLLVAGIEHAASKGEKTWITITDSAVLG